MELTCTVKIKVNWEMQCFVIDTEDDVFFTLRITCTADDTKDGTRWKDGAVSTKNNMDENTNDSLLLAII